MKTMRTRLLAIALLTAAALTAQARAAGADERYALIVSGVSGSEKIAATQDKWVADLTATLRGRLAIPGDHIVALTESGSGAAASTREGVTAALAALKPRVTANDTLMVVLIGHGTSVGTVAKFNLVGPDMDSTEWKHLIDGIAGLTRHNGFQRRQNAQVSNASLIFASYQHPLAWTDRNGTV